MADRLPPLNALRAFESAARHGSFVEAANELFVTPAAISHQVRTLEDVLGVVLFTRMARGLRLTEEGRAFLPELTKGFAHLARASQLARGGGLAGRVVVSAIPSFAQLWLLPRLHDFYDRYPEIDLELIAELRSADFAREEVDVGLRYGLGSYPGLASVQLLREEVFPVCAPGLLNRGPLRRFADLRHHRLLHDIYISGAEPTLTWARWLRDAGVSDIDPTRGPKFSDAIMMIEAAARGYGVALGRTALVADLLAAGRLVRPFAQALPADYAYYLVMSEASAARPRVQAFVRWAQEQAGAGVAGVPA